MSEAEIIAAVRAIAVELTYRGAKPGHIEPGTRERIGTFWRPLIDWHNREQVRTVETHSMEFGACDIKTRKLCGPAGEWLQPKVRATPKGVIVKAIIEHLTAAGYGAKSHSAAEHEQAIARAVTALPGLCDALEAITTHTIGKSGFSRIVSKPNGRNIDPGTVTNWIKEGLHTAVVRDENDREVLDRNAAIAWVKANKCNYQVSE